MVAAYLGHKPPAEEAPEQHDQQLQSLMQSMPVTTDAPPLATAEWDAFTAQKETPPHG